MNQPRNHCVGFSMAPTASTSNGTRAKPFLRGTNCYICAYVALCRWWGLSQTQSHGLRYINKRLSWSYRVPSPARWPRSARNSLDESSYGALYPWNPLVGTGVSRFLLHCKFVCLLHPRGHVGRANPLLSVHNPLHSCIKEILGC